MYPRRCIAFLFFFPRRVAPAGYSLFDQFEEPNTLDEDDSPPDNLGCNSIPNEPEYLEPDSIPNDATDNSTTANINESTNNLPWISGTLPHSSTPENAPRSPVVTRSRSAAHESSGFTYASISISDTEKAQAYKKERGTWEDQAAMDIVPKNSVDYHSNIVGSHVIYKRKPEGTVKARIVPWVIRTQRKVICVLTCPA